MRRLSLNSLVAILICVMLSSCPSASAWEKGTADMIAEAALASVPGRLGTFLEREKPLFMQGWEAGEETTARYAGFSTYDSSGYAARKLGSQITLLRSLFPKEQTPYMAYRLGILARIVADLNSPFATAVSPHELKLRDRFMRDIEAHRVALRGALPPPRLLRDPNAVMMAAVKRADGWAGPVRAQYLDGRGYNVIVREAAATFYRGALQMVRDVLLTVGSGGGAAEPAAKYGYYRDACDHYLKSGMVREAVAAYEKAADIIPSLNLGNIVSLRDAVEKYSLILHITSIEEDLQKAGAPPPRKMGTQLLQSYLSGLALFAERSLDAGRPEESRFALSLCMREGYMPDRTLRNCRRLYGAEGLKNLDAPGNASKIYREAGSFEEAAAKARNGGRFWIANDSYLHAAALYSAIPESVRDLYAESRAGIERIRRMMLSLPLSALLSENLFHAAIDSLESGDADAAMRDLHHIQAWKPADTDVRATIGDAEALRIFTRGKRFAEKGDHAHAEEQFRKLIQRYPRSPLYAPALEMIKLFEKKQDESLGDLLILLRGGYEASFVGDQSTAYQLCDEILASYPNNELRDRAQLLIAVAWYESNARGYNKIDKIFRDLLKGNVLDQEGADLVLKKNIDFYFGLSDLFPVMQLSQFPESVLEKLGKGNAEVLSLDEAAEDDDELEEVRDSVEANTDDSDMETARADDLIPEVESASNRETTDNIEARIGSAEDSISEADNDNSGEGGGARA